MLLITSRFYGQIQLKSYSEKIENGVVVTVGEKVKKGKLIAKRGNID